MTKTTKVLSVFPLIGGGVLGTEFLNKKGYDIENLSTAFSLSGAKANEDYLVRNRDFDIKYWDEIYADVECECVTCSSKKEFEEADYDIECKKVEECIKDNKVLIESADIILSIPPCNSLSMLNCSATNRCGKYNPASQIIMRCVEFAVKSNIQFFCFENAPRLASSAGLPILEQIEKFLKKYPGYSMNVVKTNSVWHGMAQRRERTFVFLQKRSFATKLEFDVLLNDMSVLISDIAEDGTYKRDPVNIYQDFLRSGLTRGDLSDKHTVFKLKEYYNLWRIVQDCFGNKDITTSIGKNLKEIKDLDEWLINVYDKAPWPYPEEPYIQRLKQLIRLIHKKVNAGFGYWAWEPLPTYSKQHGINCTTGIINKNMSKFVHYEFERVLFFREECRLMGIPDDFKIDIEDRRAITQNVPSFTFADMIEQYFKELTVLDGFKTAFQQVNNKKVEIYVGKDIKEVLTKKKKYSKINHNKIINL